MSRDNYQFNHKPKMAKDNKRYCEEHKAILALQAKDRRARDKLEVITHYGNGAVACVKCGFTDLRALTIDHINGDGAAHRKKERIQGDYLYVWLIRNLFPPGFQTLCMNCQMIKKKENHEERSRTSSGHTPKNQLKLRIDGCQAQI